MRFIFGGHVNARRALHGYYSVGKKDPTGTKDWLVFGGQLISLSEGTKPNNYFNCILFMINLPIINKKRLIEIKRYRITSIIAGILRDKTMSDKLI